MKNYKLVFEDKKGNDLKTQIIEANDRKDAKRIAKIAHSNSMLNDLYKIVVISL